MYIEQLVDKTEELLQLQIDKMVSKGWRVQVPIHEDTLLYSCVMEKDLPLTRAEVLSKARAARTYGKGTTNEAKEIDELPEVETSPSED